jgi:hypothetical protein
VLAAAPAATNAPPASSVLATFITVLSSRIKSSELLPANDSKVIAAMTTTSTIVPQTTSSQLGALLTIDLTFIV